MSHAEPVFVEDLVSVLEPVDGRGGEAVHLALDQHVIPQRLLDPWPGHADLGSIANNECGGEVELWSHIVAGHTHVLAPV